MTGVVEAAHMPACIPRRFSGLMTSQPQLHLCDGMLGTASKNDVATRSAFTIMDDDMTMST